ncbi:MAG: SAM-dependent DNA methyltransferase [Solirubrobacterales bacterium]|nr:SAM-dependent DNA methyltransferase [Solirubrobacterales bacterium]MCB8914332.1 SAM-dependent DNA methyltransferase [Thermoleophilales bacterium]
MTPRPVAEALLDRVDLLPRMRVLDPGVGTGELLRAVLDREPEIEAVGWDVDPGVVEAAGDLVPEARLEVRSALRTSQAEPGGFDLVIANPPYFQLALDAAERSRFDGVISGRANIFALFFQVGIEMLEPGGHLAFIVPPSMNSGAYFEALREFLTARAEVIDLTVLEGTDIFAGANTAIQLLVLCKSDRAVGRISGIGDVNPTRRGFVFRREVEEAGFRRVLFTPDPVRLAEEFENRRTLWELGLEASTGQVIWNENRDRLENDPGPDRVPLVWSRDIGATWPGRPGARPAGKPAFYLTGEGGRSPLVGPAIAVNRVVGAVGRGELRATFIPEGVEFLAENHVNVIRRRGSGSGGGKGDFPGWDVVLELLRRPDVAGRVRLLTGNTQISARELTHLLPLG